MTEPLFAFDRLLTAKEVGRILGVHPNRVYSLSIPRVQLSEKSVRWRESDVYAWIASRLTNN